MDENINEKLLLQVEEDDTDQHPCCPHGPTVLFYRQSQQPSYGFYACSAYRNPKLCSFRMDYEKWKGNPQKQVPDIRAYPQQQNDADPDPTSHLKALSQDDVHAQYFFDQQALKFFADQCRLLKIDKVVCMGAPRLHFHLRIHKIQSFLLDFDERFSKYLSPQEFCLYNMCNNHFFYQREPFERFLKCNKDERVLIVTDPPFGCRTELIAHTLRSLMRLHNRLNQLPATPLSIFWVYPYYMANYIRQDMPELQMCDYKLNYTNHSRYTNVGNSKRSYGSPVRVFTNIPLELLRLPLAEGYKYCDRCQRDTAIENVHCDRCRNCCSQNGQTYRHCQLCDMCVKPNYVHCSNCRRCCQRVGHDCALYQSMQHCWLCGQRGHIESNCQIWSKLSRQSKRRQSQRDCCLICGAQSHRERNCSRRCSYFKEFEFMGQILTKARDRKSILKRNKAKMRKLPKS
ncbi:PREDICTED: zinc finger CCHC domain-containing protein 4 [Drosophila arizonae]|uniref:Zinc finger CCHC domain-containing protein 4 n=1 Tax=Drosophila arizonae TaxID=7263 RepID=A0ABM1PK68_DROAR|nr:PREDICTED: zinc finger CCHC domain-containing protein 4 [Drosophila arizonae]